MTCSDVLDRVEAIAGGEWEPDAATRAHLDTCAGCAGALRAARRIEAALASLPAPDVPRQFTAAVIQRVRLDEWQAEERVDRLFNIGVVVALVLMIGGVAALFNAGGLIGFAGSAWGLVTSVAGRVASEAAPALGLYLAGACLLLTAVAMWWWAERRLSL